MGQRERADRILDAAKDLLLRRGYRRVTIDEIARHAGVGKGTVYLHWRSREELFLAVGAREAAGMLTGIAAAVRADPAEAGLDRYMRGFFVGAMHRPVLRAIFTRDAETLDKFLDSPARQDLQTAKLVASRAYLDVLREHGMLRAGLRAEDLDHALPAVVYGFFAIEPLLPDGSGPSLEAKADSLADTLRHAFGPARPPARSKVTAAGKPAAEILDRHAGDYRAIAYGTGE